MIQFGLFCIYLFLIMVLVFLETIKVPFTFTGGFKYNGLTSIFTIDNIVPFLCLIVIVIALFTLYRLKCWSKNRSQYRPRIINKISSWEYDYVPTFVTLLAIVSFSYIGIRGLLLFIGIMLIIYAIFVCTSMFYTSPLYRILGLNIYQSQDKQLGGNSILMSFEELSDTETLYYRKICTNVYYVTKA